MFGAQGGGREQRTRVRAAFAHVQNIGTPPFDPALHRYGNPGQFGQFALQPPFAAAFALGLDLVRWDARLHPFVPDLVKRHAANGRRAQASGQEDERFRELPAPDGGFKTRDLQGSAQNLLLEFRHDSPELDLRR
jgi:hypothetical protein